jgi:hypothetical protein
MKSTAESISQLRSVEAFESFLTKARSIVSELPIANDKKDFPTKRIQRRKRQFDESAAPDHTFVSKFEEYLVSVYYVVIDAIVEELKERAENFGSAFEVFKLLIPSEMKEASSQSFAKWAEKICQVLPTDFSNPSYSLAAQLESFRNLYFLDSENKGTPLPLHMLNYILQTRLRDVFPDVEIALRIFLSTPVSTASNERTFSTMRHVKSYLRSVMSDERLSSLCLLAIEKNVARNLDLTKTVEIFADRCSRRPPKM